MIRRTALALTVLTGFSGLVYEVTWEKVLATLLGSHSEATAAVLGLFLGGLAAGYALFGAFTRRRLERAAARGEPARLLLAYGLLESAIGVTALLFPLLFAGVQALSFAIPHGGGGAGFALDVFLSALLILPPTILMGGTIPILTQALASDLDDATRVHAWVYGFNTAGAFAGALAAGFWIVPRLGLVGALLAMGCVNLFAGATFVVLGRRPEPPAETPPQATAPAEVPGYRSFAAAALLAGFAMMTVQTVVIRLGSLSFGASQFTFSMVVAVFVLCIALGSLAVSALPRIPGGLLAANLWLLVASFAVLYPRLADAPYWAHRLRLAFPLEESAFEAYYLAAFGGVLATIGLPVILSGATLPLVFDHLRHRVGDLGEVAGRLYSWNTVGSLLGALIGGYALLFWLDLHHAFRIALAALAVAATLVTRQSLDPARARWAPALLVPGLAVALALPAWSPEKLSSGLFRERQPLPDSFHGAEATFAARAARAKLRFYDDDPVMSVAVKDVAIGGGEFDHTLWSNGKPDGAVIGDFVTMSLVALVPALLAEQAHRVFVVGWGTGATVGAFASLSSVREIVVAELSPAVMQAAPIFEEDNGGALAFPGLRVVESDAYRTLMRSDESFDVIVSVPSNPWVTGVEMLYSKEFLEAARDRLTPGGVHAQWFHLYETDAATVHTVLRTYTEVFDHVAVWFGMGEDLILLGLQDPEGALDVDRLEARAARPDVAAALRRAKVESFAALLAHELLPLGVVHELALDGEPHTLLHPRLQYQAARGFFAGRLARLPVTAGGGAAELGARHSLLRRLAQRSGGQLPARDRSQVVAETCIYRERECLTLLAQWLHDDPGSPTRQRVVAAIEEKGLERALEEIEPLAALFDPAAPGAADGGDPVGRAATSTLRFGRYYHHGAPFSPEALATLWRGCETSDPERCAHAREQATRWLGGEPGGA